MATLKVPVGPDDHAQGNPKAPITLVEYGDYECPACGLAYPIVKAVQKHFAGISGSFSAILPWLRCIPMPKAPPRRRSGQLRITGSGRCMMPSTRTRRC